MASDSARFWLGLVVGAWLTACTSGAPFAMPAQSPSLSGHSEAPPLVTVPDTEPREEAPSLEAEATSRGDSGASTAAADATATATAARVSPPAEVAVIDYDRNRVERIDPVPDDFYLVDDPDTATKKRVEFPQGAGGEGLLRSAIAALGKLDGMSPLAPIVVSLPATLDSASVPVDADDSLAPDASMYLLDVDRASPELGQRVPLYVLQRSGEGPVLLVFPARPLRARGHYAFVITRSARTTDGRELGPSRFMTRVLAGAPESDAEQLLSNRLSDLITANHIQKDSVALLLSISTRSTEHLADDLLNVRQQLLAARMPTLTISDVSAPDREVSADIAAIVKGTWQAPTFADGDMLARDEAGHPQQTGMAEIPFVLALPRAALTGPAPLVMYQHGVPGNAETEVPVVAGQRLAAEGFAMIGFTDFGDREISRAGTGIQLYLHLFTKLLLAQRIPDHLSLLTLVEQQAFLRLIPALGSIDVLPLGEPDGQPDIAAQQPLGYLGISGGAQHGLGSLAFAPEIRAAALSAAGGRLSALMVQQLAEPAYELLSALDPTLTRTQLYAVMALVQMAFDDQDPLNLAAFAFRQPGGSAPLASVLMTEGLGDTLVPVSSTRSAAWQLGLAQLADEPEPLSFLAQVSAPYACDVARGARGALYQYVPRDYPGIPATPGCASAEWGSEGHRCAHHAPEALYQRTEFFRSALSGVPQIIDPLR